MYRLGEIAPSEHNTFDFYRSVMPDCLTLKRFHVTIPYVSGSTGGHFKGVETDERVRTRQQVTRLSFALMTFPSGDRGFHKAIRSKLNCFTQQNGPGKRQKREPEPNAKGTSAMTNHTPTTSTQQAERFFCPSCGAEMLLDTQADYRLGHEGESFTIATCPNSPDACTVGQATTTTRRLEDGSFFTQWSAIARYELRTGKAK